MIESRLDPIQLKRYRHWKQDLRASLGQKRGMLSRVISERSLKRPFDQDFQPIFLGGMSGSGTTLLIAMLNQSFQSRVYLIASDKTPETSRLLYRENSSYYSGFDEYLADLYAPLRYSPARIRKAVLEHYRRSAEYPYASSTVFDKSTNSRLVRFGLLQRAFPKAKGILIYRDPVYVIEGLRRKWPHLYGGMNADSLSDYWNELHQSFLANTKIDARIMLFSYAAFKKHSEAIIAKVGSRFDLDQRTEAFEIEDKGDQRGKGLSNVQGGRVEISKKSRKVSRDWISPEDENLIRERTRSVFEQLEQLSDFAQ